jgi:chromosome segregation ATPase
MSKTSKPSQDATASDTELEIANLTQLLAHAEARNAELQAELEPLQEANAQLNEQVVRLEQKITELEEALNIALQARNDQAGTIERLQTELDAQKSEKLPQAIRLDVLCAAAFNRSPATNPTTSARLAVELHNALLAECKKATDNA